MIVELAKKIEHRANCLHVYARLSNGILPRPQAMIVAKGWERTLIYRGMYRFIKCLKTRGKTQMDHDEKQMRAGNCPNPDDTPASDLNTFNEQQKDVSCFRGKEVVPDSTKTILDY